MLTSAVLTLAFAATGFAQLMPEGYRNVYITSMVDTKFIVVPVAPVKNGTKLVVYVSLSARLPRNILISRSQTNTNKLEQTWYIKANATKIQLANTTLCLDAGAKSMLSNKLLMLGL